MQWIESVGGNLLSTQMLIGLGRDELEDDTFCVLAVYSNDLVFRIAQLRTENDMEKLISAIKKCLVAEQPIISITQLCRIEKLKPVSNDTPKEETLLH